MNDIIGTGTLCESLLMVEAQKGGIIFPNKKSSAYVKFSLHRLLLLMIDIILGSMSFMVNI